MQSAKATEEKKYRHMQFATPQTDRLLGVTRFEPVGKAYLDRVAWAEQRIEARPSKLHGTGVFAKTDFKAGQPLMHEADHPLSHMVNDGFAGVPSYAELVAGCKDAPDIYARLVSFAAKYNAEAKVLARVNVGFEQFLVPQNRTVFLIAVRDIPEGTELTMFYGMYVWLKFWLRQTPGFREAYELRTVAGLFPSLDTWFAQFPVLKAMNVLRGEYIGSKPYFPELATIEALYLKTESQKLTKSQKKKQRRRRANKGPKEETA